VKPTAASAATTLITLGSSDLASQLTSVFAVLLVLAAAAALATERATTEGNRRSSVTPGSVRTGHLATLAAAFFAVVLLLLGIVNATQELRRCVTPLCMGRTMYGSRDACLAPCRTAYSAWQVPALVANVLAVALSARFAYRVYNFVDSLASQ
jgi:hypothetical protein